MIAALRFVAAATLLTGIFPADACLRAWFTWWLGDAVGILIVTPFLVCWSHWLAVGMTIKAV